MKNTIHILKILFLLLNFSNIYSQDIYDLSNSKKYALFLYKTSEFKKAAIEFERVCFLDSTDWDSKFLLMKSYRKNKNYYSAINTYRKSNLLIPPKKLNNFKNEYFKSLFHYDINKILSDSFNEKDTNFYYFKMPAVLLTDKWKNFDNIYITDSTLKESIYNNYFSSYKEIKSINYKKPFLAAISSAIVPGTGKIYTGYYKDGIMAFLFTGLSAYQAYRGYKSKGIKSGIFLVYSGITAGFYLGNIYGSYKSAIQKNKLSRKKIDKKTIEYFDNWAD
ncbi:MAG: hypothetical protein IT243_07365 [Bacteroidia bacterium]|nr:hypothetical protein [Bacteroidia bacterium]